MTRSSFVSGSSGFSAHDGHDGREGIVELTGGVVGLLTNIYSPGFCLKGCGTVLGFIRC